MLLQVFASMEILLTAISMEFPRPEEQLLRVVTTACLMHGFHSRSNGYRLSPVSCCQIGVAVKHQMPNIQGRLLANLEMEPCRSYLQLIPGEPGCQPAVLPDVAAMIGTAQHSGLQFCHPSVLLLLCTFEKPCVTMDYNFNKPCQTMHTV